MKKTEGQKSRDTVSLRVPMPMPGRRMRQMYAVQHFHDEGHCQPKTCRQRALALNTVNYKKILYFRQKDFFH
jgi:hypothetical protein